MGEIVGWGCVMDDVAAGKMDGFPIIASPFVESLAAM